MCVCVCVCVCVFVCVLNDTQMFIVSTVVLKVSLFVVRMTKIVKSKIFTHINFKMNEPIKSKKAGLHFSSLTVEDREVSHSIFHI